MGVIVSGETAREIIAYCPFHKNRDSPAFNVSLRSPNPWRCHNAKCNKRGKTILSLITLKGFSHREAEKMLLSGEVEVDDLVKLVIDMMSDKKEVFVDEWRGVDPENFRDADRKAGYPAKLYLSGRGISEEAYDYFRMGYSPSKRMLVVPVFNEYDRLVGVIGREIESKRYQYSTGLGRGQLIWNLSNAKVHDTIILTEGSLDAVYLWQAGFPNVGAVLGSSISPDQWNQIRKYFTNVICFFDNDDAGDSLALSVCESVRDLAVSYVEYPDRKITFTNSLGEAEERNVKDPGDLTQDEIKGMVEDRKSSIHLLF